MASGEGPTAGLPGAKDLHARLRSAIEERRFGALFLFDVDGIKKVNSEHGTAVGDRVIGGIERFLLMRGDQGYRIGGDQFGMIVDRADLPFDGEAFRMGASLEIASEIGLHVTLSGGGVADPGDELIVDPGAAEILLSTTRLLLTRAKQKGRDQVLWLHQDRDDSVETLRTTVRFYAELARVNAAFARRMEVESRIDFLTGLYNRRGFDDIARKLVEASRRNDRPIGLLYLDSDSLKEINDTLGHEAGDRFIVDMARILSEVVRGSDFTFRWGADEFAVLIDHATEEKAAALAARIRQAIASRTRGTVSIGIFCGVPGGVEDAVNRADRALYRAKELGKNRTEVAG